MWLVVIYSWIVLVLLPLAVAKSDSSPSPSHVPSPLPTTSKHYTLFERYYTNAYQDLEYLLAAKEYERTIQTYKYLADHNYEVYGFYHTSAKHGNWKQVVTEQLYLLDGRRKFPTKNDLNNGIYDYAAYSWEKPSDRPSPVETASSSTTSTTSSSPSNFAALLNYTTGLVLNVGIIHSLDEYHNMVALVDSLQLTYRHKIILSYNYTYSRDVFSKAFYVGRNEKNEEAHLRNQTYLDEIRAKKNGSSGEFPTMMLMQGFCRDYMARQDRVEYASWFNTTTTTTTSPSSGGGGGGKEADLKNMFYQSDRIPSKYVPDYDYGGQNMFERLLPKQPSSSSSSQPQLNPNKPKKAIVFYFHNKGSCCLKTKETMRDPNPVVTWREVMNAFILEFPSICLRAIGQKKASSCGPLFQDGYYSGTFWYSECSHIAQLPVLPDPLDWGQPEFFVGQHMHPAYHVFAQFFQHCSYSAYHSFRNMYGDECPRKEYVQRIWDSIMAKKLPPTMGLESSDRAMQNKPELGKICKQLREPHHYYGLLKQMPNTNELSEKLHIYAHNKNPRRLYLEMEEVIDFFLRKYN